MANSGSWMVYMEGFGNIANNNGANDVELAFKNFINALKTAGHKIDQARLGSRYFVLQNSFEDNLNDPVVSALYSATTQR